jgi:hypothetical protein
MIIIKLTIEEVEKLTALLDQEIEGLESIKCVDTEDELNILGSIRRKVDDELR